MQQPFPPCPPLELGRLGGKAKILTKIGKSARVFSLLPIFARILELPQIVRQWQKQLENEEGLG